MYENYVLKSIYNFQRNKITGHTQEKFRGSICNKKSYKYNLTWHISHIFLIALIELILISLMLK